MRVAAVIAAGGQGIRVGAPHPKQFIEIEGKSLLQRSVEIFVASPRIDEIIVALPAADAHDPPSYLREVAKPLTVVAGGDHRQASVARAFARVSETIDIVVIHDAARPFVSEQLIARTIDAAARHGAAIAALPVHETVKQAMVVGHERIVERTLPREAIFLAQTPQAFTRTVLARAMALAEAEPATDEAMLAERAGVQVYLVEGEAPNIKVTTDADLVVARASLSSGRHGGGAAWLRIGAGYDLHRLVSGRPLILGGVRIPFDHGLDGHSDADIVCHAVTDAVLGAAAAGDIGRLFPDTDAKWKNADSLTLLSGAMDVVHQSGYGVANVDVTVIAERPKLLPYLEVMRANLARALGVKAGAVSIKGKTNEKLGEIGRLEAMACHAVVLLISSQ